MAQIEVVGAVVNQRGAILFLKNGSQRQIDATDFRIQQVLEQVSPALARQEPVTIDLDDYSVIERIEKKSGGLIKFFKRKVEDVKSFFGKRNSATLGVSTGETLVAVVGGVEIEGMELLESHMMDAAYGKSYPGYEAFMKRLAKVIHKRKHSIDELLVFMEKGDLPIADDGCIVAYKILKTESVEEGFPWVDPHSGRVPQRVGSFVTMAEELVDDNRRQACSTGLHIARRDYIRGFMHWGGTITIVKVAPEDVIAVPLREAAKMRACGYLICAELTPGAIAALRENKPLTEDSEAARLLTQVLRGHHTKRTETVIIGSAYGGDITIKYEDGVTASVAPVQPETEGVEEAKVVESMGGPGKVEPEQIKKLNDLKLAAASGDMSAAISEPAEAPKPKAATKSQTKKKTQPAAVSVNPSLSERDQKALQMRDEGKSMRTIAAELKMCRKTMRKLFDANPSK